MEAHGALRAGVGDSPWGWAGGFGELSKRDSSTRLKAVFFFFLRVQ